MQTYGEVLRKNRLTERARAKQVAFLQFLLVAGMACLSESEDAPYSWLTLFILAVYAIQNYKENNYHADRSLAIYLAEMRLRKSAEANDPKRLKECVFTLGQMAVAAQDADTGQNALHCAVKGEAADTINYLLVVDHNIHRTQWVQKKPDIINVQDKLGNTPVHDAILSILKEATSTKFLVLIELLKGRNGIKPGFLIKAAPDTNQYVNPSLKNNEGLTIVGLFNKITDKKLEAYPFARTLLQEIVTQKQRANKTKNSNDTTPATTSCSKR